MGATICTNWHTSDVEYDGVLSCDCGADDEDSPKGLLRLSSTDKLNQITVSRNLFSIYYIMCMCIYHIVFRSCILYYLTNLTLYGYTLQT